MNNKFIIAIVTLLVILIIIAMCRDASEIPEITPTLAISETPSITPAPPTATATLVVTVDVFPITATATETAVSPPQTAVSPSPTPDHLQGMTSTAVLPSVTPTSAVITDDIGTATPTSRVLQVYIVEPGDCLACLSWDWYGTGAKWGEIWRANGMFPKPHLIFPGQELIRPK